MTKLYFIRHAKLDLPYKNHAEMPLSVLFKLGAQQLNPPIDQKFITKQTSALLARLPLDKAKTIYYSPSRRCVETSEFLINLAQKKYHLPINKKCLRDLDKIPFNLKRIYPKKQVEMKELNRAILQAMINGQGAESTVHAYQRIKKVFAALTKDADGDIIIVTHDFIMRILEIFIKNKGLMPKNYQTVLHTQTNDYLQGFVTNAKMSAIKKLTT